MEAADSGFESSKRRRWLCGVELKLLDLLRRTVSEAGAKDHPAVLGLSSPEIWGVDCVEGNP
jgi:hypothetical protein